MVDTADKMVVVGADIGAIRSSMIVDTRMRY
jgi:hypothetical protein